MKLGDMFTLFSILALGFIPFYLFGMTYSPEAFISPYMGENAITVLALMAGAILFFLFINLSFIPSIIHHEKSSDVVLTLSSLTAIFGIWIAILSQNPWSGLPYAAISFANFWYLYLKINQKT